MEGHGRPLKMMDFLDALRSVFLIKPFDFSGRASRSEYWWSYLGYMIFSTFFQFVIIIIMMIPLLLFPETPEVSMIFLLIALIPVLILIGLPILTVSVRRLHDVGYSGWWYLLLLIPLANLLFAIAFLILFVSEGNGHENQYGPVPTNSIEGLESYYKNDLIKKLM